MLLDAIEISSVEDDSITDLISDPDEARLVYEHKNGIVELHMESLSCLNFGTYFKDTIIQFYSAYLLNELIDESISSRAYIFDSIFYNTIAKVFSDQKEVDVLKHSQLGRWYNNEDIFAKSYLIFPICLDNHWFAIVVCNPSAVPAIETYDQEPTNSENTTKLSKRPGIMILDSLGLKNHDKASTIVRDFLDYEWRIKYNELKRFGHHDLPDYYPELPRQDNHYDCGLFMLMYIKTFLENPPKFYRLVVQGEYQYLSTYIEKNLESNSRKTIKTLMRQVCKPNQM